MCSLKTDRMQFDEIVGGCIRESIEFAQNSQSGMICLGADSPMPETILKQWTDPV